MPVPYRYLPALPSVFDKVFCLRYLPTHTSLLSLSLVIALVFPVLNSCAMWAGESSPRNQRLSMPHHQVFFPLLGGSRAPVRISHVRPAGMWFQCALRGDESRENVARKKFIAATRCEFLFYKIDSLFHIE